MMALALLLLPWLAQDSLATWHRLDQAAPSHPAAQEPTPAATTPLQVVPWQQAGEHVGETIIVKGMVVRTHDSGKATFLNFDEDWQGKFSAVIFASTACTFPAPPARLLEGKTIHLRGKVKMYKGAPEIVIESTAQLLKADGTPMFPAGAISGPQAPPHVAPAAEGVRLMSWNVENFFDRYDDPFTRDEVTSPAYVDEARMQRIADAIHFLNPDVLCLEEVENRPLLEQFNQAYLADLGYEAILIEGNDSRGIDVAMLTRLPIESVTSYRHLAFPGADGEPLHFRRDLLRVRLGGKFAADVFVVHLKSQHGGAAADAIREAESRAAVAILQAEMAASASYRAVITGDFNEVVEEPTIQQFLAAGLRDSCAGTKRISYNQEPHLSRIDFALLTPALHASMASARIVDQLDGVNLKCCSDHYPVVVEFASAAVTPVVESTDRPTPPRR